MMISIATIFILVTLSFSLIFLISYLILEKILCSHVTSLSVRILFFCFYIYLLIMSTICSNYHEYLFGFCLISSINNYILLVSYIQCDAFYILHQYWNLILLPFKFFLLYSNFQKYVGSHQVPSSSNISP